MQIHSGSIWGWRWIFIVEGALTVVAGFVAWFFLVDFPQRASFLDDYQRQIVIERLNKDRGDGEHDQITPEKIFMHLRDPKVWGFALIVFLLPEIADLSSLVPRLLVTH
jgi:predicted MFS family arabinose efflux permease